MMEKQTGAYKLDQPFSIWFLLFVPLFVAAFLSLMIFPLAGDWAWPEGWIFVLTLSLNIAVGTAIINQKNPRVLRNRSRLKKEGLTRATEKPAASDRFIMPMTAVGGLGAILLAAWGHRLGWYSLPFAAAVLGSLMVNLGALLLQAAQNQNAHASKILDINKGQVLVDTGLYGRVRHPIYSGFIVMILFWPVALGSLWGLPLALLACAGLAIRIQFEEEMLLKGMEGYADYQSRVKYKLIPGVY
ncbi:MAG: methyltransferase family protein [Anaerolineales bacterium]